MRSRFAGETLQASPAPGPARKAVRALGALTVLVSLFAGIPTLLIRFTTWPITGAPTGDQLRELPSTVATDDVLLGVVTVLLWVAWAVFVASVVIEVVAQVRARARGVTRPTRSFGGPFQGVARYLVGSLLMGAGPMTGVGMALPAGAATPALESPPAAAVEYGSFWMHGGDEASDIGNVLADDLVVGSATELAASDATASTVTVGRADTAWSLAADHLGDGARWREIWEANRSRVQADGSVWADADQPVQPGWTLEVPGGVPASPVAPSGPAPAPAVADTPVVQGLTSSPVTPTEVTVTTGDNFWELAEGQLTDAWGRAPSDAEVAPHWQSLIEVNHDGLAPPGDPNLIYPGQVFSVPTPPPDPAIVQGLVTGVVLGEPAPAPPAEAPDCDPEDATVPPPAPTAETPPPTGDEAVEDGESDLGAGAGSGADAGSGAGTGSESGAGTEPAGSDDTDAPAEGSATAPAPDAGPAESPSPSVPPDPPRTDPPPTDPTEVASTGAEADDDGGLRSLAPIGLVGGGVAVAGALVLLERRRRAQQRHRRPGRVIPSPPVPLHPHERDLRWGADIDSARLLDVAVRAAAAGSGATGLPPLRWVETGPGAVVLVLATPSPAPPGYVALGPDRWATAAGPDELAAMAAHAAPPAPTLVPVGMGDAGTEVLIDLETAGAATVHANPQDAQDFLRALVVAAATSVWSEQVRVVTVGLDPQLDRLPGVTAVPSLGEALALAEDHADRVAAALRSLRCQTLAQARAVGATPEAWDPLLVVADAAPRDRDEHRRLAALASRPDCGVGLVLRPGIEDLAGGRAFSIGEHGWLAIDDVDEPVRPRLLDAAGVAAVIGLLDHAAARTDAPAAEVASLAPRRPPVPPPPPPPVRSGSEPADDADLRREAGRPDDHAGDAPDDPIGAAPPEGGDASANGQGAPSPERVGGHRGSEDLVGTEDLAVPVTADVSAAPLRVADLLADVQVVVRVLGEVQAVRLDGAGGQELLVPTRQRALEAIAYLALRESAVDREDLEISLFPTGANAAKTIYNTVSAARALVGEDLFPATGSGRYELSASVVTDYGVFCELIATADEIEDAAAAAALLTDALGLVRGEPFTGVGRGYAWVGPHRGMIVAQVVDAAEELAEVRLATGDWRSAEWAARQGLRAFPSDERMYRLLMRTARAAGNIPGVQRVFRELCDVLADPDIGVEPEDTVHPETIELLEQLTGAPPRQGRLGA